MQKNNGRSECPERRLTGGRLSRRFAAAALLALAAAAALHPGAAAAQHDNLTIGITQFPSTLQPEHRCDGGEELRARDDAAAVHGLRRRLEARLPALRRACPSIENGGAVRSICRAAGKGIDLTYTIRARRQLGRRRAGDHIRRAVHLRGRAQPGECGQRRRALPPHHRHRRQGRQDLHPARRQADLRLRGDRRFRAAAGASRSEPPSPIRRNTGCAPATTPTRPTPASTTGPTGSPRFPRARTSCSSRTRIGPGQSRPFRRITVRAIENTAALEANLLSGTIDMIAGELGLLARRGARLREAPPRRLSNSLQAGPRLRACRLQPRTPRPRRSAGAPGAAFRPRPRGDQPSSSSPGASRSPTVS